MIGITAYAEPSVRWGAWDVPAAVIPLAYVQQVEAITANLEGRVPVFADLEPAD